MSSEEPVNLSLTDLLAVLFESDTPARYTVRSFCMSMQANRMLEFGFEPHISRYSPRELVLLASKMPDTQQEILFDEAIKDKDVADAFNKLMGVVPEVA